MRERTKVSKGVYDAELALLVDKPPAGDRWLHELKLDGYRLGVLRDGRSVKLISRRGSEWTSDFPELVDSAKELRAKRALLDGEVVMLSERGVPDFQALQNRARARGQLAFFAFDLLELNGKDLRGEPLERRKELLHDLLGDATGIIRYTHHFVGDGDEVLRKACALGAEGIVSKRRDSPYRSGARHPDWQKAKCTKRQEFVVGGFTDPEGARVGVGSMLIGYYDGPHLRFAGKVGTGRGWSHTFSLDLRRRLEKLAQKTSPFEPPPAGWLGRNAHWVKPKLVAEVEFSEWTEGGHVRHPSLQGFRTDKKPRDVKREVAVHVGTRHAGRGTRSERGRSRPSLRVPRPDELLITHPDAAVYPKLGISKEDLLQLYIDICGWALPHVARRPLTLVRRKQPITRADALRSQCVFLHHRARDQRWAPEWMPRLEIQEKKKTGEYLWVDSTRALLALLEGDIVEWHVWNATVDDVEHPDRIVFDLDPGERVDFGQVVAAAQLVRERLGMLDLESWVKTTGGKGLHVVVPFRPEHEWDDVFAFSREVAETIAAECPEAYTVSFDKGARVGKVLIDYKRNYRTSIAVAGFSTRARPDGAISVPLRWTDISDALSPDRFTVATIRDRLRRLRTDPWAGYWKSRQRLPIGRTGIRATRRRV